MKTVGSETHGHETNEIAWVAYFENEVAGVIGLRHLKSSYAIIDVGPAVKPDLDAKIQKKLLYKLINLAIKHSLKYTKVLFSHNAEEMIEKLITDYDFEISKIGLPDKEYSHPCLKCKYRGKECFPVLLKKQLI